MKKEALKLVVIGGGSSYTPELIEGLIKRHGHLPVKELWLVDIEDGKQKLEIIALLARRMVKKAGTPIEVYTTLERTRALRGADFVITQVRVGLLAGRIKDERIPLSHGVTGQETNGPGGLFLGLRTIPVILQIAKEMEKLCPDAWLVNFSNPSGMVTEALLRYSTNRKVVGLCNVPFGVQRALSAVMGVDPSRLRLDFAGLNHMVFGLRTYLDGKDVSEEATQAMATSGVRISMNNIPPIHWEPQFIEALKVLPCPYLRYYFKADESLHELLEEFKKGETRAELVSKMEDELFRLYQDEDLDVKPPQLEKRGGAYYSDAACNLIDSIHNNKGDIQTVNTRNRGALEDLGHDSAVEVSCLITGDGPKPIAMGRLPAAVRGIVQQLKAFEETAAEAAVTGDYGTGLLAMTMHPLVPSDRMAKILFDEMLLAHEKDLPQFQRAKKQRV